MGLEIRYHKDLNHNYLIMQKEEETAAGSFRLRMLTENQMNFFLPCFVRKVNNQKFLYYEISSRQSFNNMSLIRELGWIELMKFFESLEEAVREAEEYLLPGSGIVLQPDFIFVEPEKMLYSFLYDPESDEHLLQLDEFATFLIDRVNAKDEKAVNMAYYVYEQIQEKSFILADVIRYFRNLSVENNKLGLSAKSSKHNNDQSIGVNGEWNGYKQEISNHSNSESKGTDYKSTDYKSTDYRNIDYKNIDYKDKYNLYIKEENEEDYDNDECIEGNDDNYEEKYDEDDGESEEQSVEELLDKKRRLGITIGLFLLCLLAVGGLLYLRFTYTLSSAESAMTIVGAVILLAVAAFLIQYLASMPIRKQFYKQPKEENSQIRSVSINKKEYLKDNEELLLYEIEMQKREKYHDQSATSHEESGEYGNTIFIAFGAEERENKLYSMNKGKKQHIILGKYPFTVGKMAGGVDGIMKDESVSRIHARFHEEEGIVYITDLNSTNGTFKNGLRMEPNSSQSIEPGDELRFGLVNYIFR